LPDNWIIAVR